MPYRIAMDNKEILRKCEIMLKNSVVKEHEPMSKHTTFKIGGEADIYIVSSSVEDVVALVKFAKENVINLTIVGNGSNLLVKDKGIRGIVLKLDLKNIDIKIDDENNATVTCGAGVQNGFLAQKLLNESIAGFEFASGIPGTIGGAVRMNAGAYGGELKDIVVKTTCIDSDGNIKVLSNSEQNFSYRHSIFCDEKMTIIETEIKLKKVENSEEIAEKMKNNLEQRKSKQPVNMPNAGSTFKRGTDFITAMLIDECGLKGYSIGGAQVSTVHAGFVVNTGNATASDVLSLVEYVKKCVFEKTGKKIEMEVEVLGE